MTSTLDPRRWWALAVVSLSLLVISLDNTILNVALPTIERDLGATAGQLQWIVDSYLLVFAGLLLTMGSLGDRFGRKRAWVLGLAVFGLGSATAAFADGSTMLIASRALMGVGGALIMPATLSIVTNMFPANERPKAIGAWAAVAGLGMAIGPTAGGFLLEHFDWGAVFLVNLPIVAVALLAGSRLVPESRDPEAGRLDPAGAVLSIAGLTALVYALIDAPEAGWASAQTIGLFAFAAAVSAAFVAWELRSAHPMLDVRVFANRRFSAASGSLTLAFFALMGAIFYLTQFLQGVLGYTPLEAGVRLLPIAGGMVVAAPLSAVLSTRLGTKVTVAAGMGLVAAGLGLMVNADAAAGYGPVALSLVVLAFGMGLAMAPATESVMGSLSLEHSGVGSAMNDTARLVGGALGVAVLGSVLSSGYRGGMDGAPEAAQESLSAALATGDASVIQTASDAFVSAMHTTSIVAAAAAAVGAVVAAVWLPARAEAPARSHGVAPLPEPAAA
jgi:EmrB/QacA subfamily drug resistance transporter